jgi:hypothetical protein
MIMKARVAGLALIIALTIGADTRPSGPFHVAYIVPAGTVGNQQLPPAEAQSIGMDFDVNKDIDVVALGVFDSEGDGFPSPLHARVYDRDTRQSIAQIWFLPCSPGKLRDGSRFLSLKTPLRLPAGFHGTISVAYLGNPLEPNGNMRVSPGEWTTDGADGAITFVGMGRHSFMGTGDVFPDVEEESPEPNNFAAGTFLYRVP